jgi:hypothetical protein
VVAVTTPCPDSSYIRSMCSVVARWRQQDPDLQPRLWLALRRVWSARGVSPSSHIAKLVRIELWRDIDRLLRFSSNYIDSAMVLSVWGAADRCQRQQKLAYGDRESKSLIRLCLSHSSQHSASADTGAHFARSEARRMPCEYIFQFHPHWIHFQLHFLLHFHSTTLGP